MVYKDEVCLWFKDNESHRRLELLCGLLNMCLPFELRFIRTCVEDLGKRDELLRDLDSKANNSSELSQLGKVLDERTRSKFVVYVALLEANNQTCSKILFEILSNAKQIPNSALTSNINDNINYIKEMLLIYTMVLNHPAFTFEEKRVIGERLQDLQTIEEQITSSKEPWSLSANYESTSQDIDSCHPISNSQILETCDSGLSIGTEPEGEILSDHACVHSGNQLPKSSGNSSCDNKFSDVNTADRPTLNPSIGIKTKGNRLSNVNDTSAASVNSENPSVKNPKQCPVNRDASSSGSGESLDLYGENLSVPTTYIYNSNICEHPNLSEVSAVALNSNLINFTPGYMYQHNGRCHFYHYPSLMGGVLPSMPLPHKLSPLGVSSETSSSEEGVTPQASVKLKEELHSPLSSSHSSPYVSPPQSLTPSRASSPKETVTTVASSHISLGLVTCTTTTIVISRSNERPLIRHNNNGSNCSSISSSGTTNSQPSSPALSNNNSQVNRNKPHMLGKCRKYNDDRSYDLITNLDNLPVENSVRNSNDSTNLHLQKESSSDSKFYNSKDTIVNSNTQCSNNVKYSDKSTENIHKGIPINIKLTKDVNDKNTVESNCKTVVSNALSNASTFPSSVSFKTSSSVIPNVNTFVTQTMQKGIPICGHTSPLKMKVKNAREEGLSKENSIVKGKYDGIDNLNSRLNTEKDKTFKSLPNGFNEHLIISSAHSVPVKHSIVNTSSVPSCSCTHISSPTGNLFLENGKTTPESTIQKVQSAVVGCSENNHINSNSTEKSLENMSNCTICSNIQKDSSQPCPHASKNHPNFSQVDVSGSLKSTSSLDKHGSNNPKTSQHNSSLTSVSLSNVVSSSSNAKHSQPIIEALQNSNTSLSMSRSPADNIPQTQSSLSLSSSTQIGGCIKSSAPIYTTTTSSTNCSIVSLVPSPSTYPPYISIPMIPGGGASTLLTQGAYHIPGHQRNPSHHTLFLTSPPGIIPGNPGHVIKNPTRIPPPGPHSVGNKSRGGSSGRSGSSSSSSSSCGLNRKKGMVRGNVYQNKSRSSDSSPSSSQYSSPPQTPSPDHTKDTRSKAGCNVPGKPNENFAVEDIWEPSEQNGHYLPLQGAREEETPPPHAMGAHVVIPSNPIRQRYFPYHHPLGFIGYHHSHHGMYRYPLASPVMIGPRPATPLSSEKSSRETTPPNQIHTVMGPPEMQQKVAEYAGTVTSCAPSSSSYNMGAVVSVSSMGPSSSSPPIPNAVPENSNITLVPPPPSQSGHSGPVNGGLNSNIPHYNSPNYPMFAMGASPFMTPLPGFMQSSSGIPNGYVSPHNLPHNYPVPSIPSGINSGELVYPNPYPVLPQSTLATSSCGVHPTLHQSSGHAPIISPSPTLPPPYSPSYHGNPPPAPSNPVPPPIKKTLTCYNCGKVGHRGSECREASIDEMTKRAKVL